jgi:hypothetical protein
VAMVTKSRVSNFNGDDKNTAQRQGSDDGQ